MKINYGGKTFLTDPMLASKGAYTGFLYRDQLVNPTAPLPMSIDEIMDGVDCILVSHSHIPADGKGGPSDHFDATAIKEIDKSMPIYIQACDAEGVRAVGFNNVHEIEDSITVDNIKITRFDGLHTDIEDFLPMVNRETFLSWFSASMAFTFLMTPELNAPHNPQLEVTGTISRFFTSLS
jgi:L-ascorbate metabolism protein UlaG (beta-lactamase superfamily)